MVEGQPEWDPAQHASYICPSIVDIVEKLELAFKADLGAMQAEAVAFAGRYDADLVYAAHWRPFLDTLDAVPTLPPLEREPIPTGPEAVAVVVPVMKRPENVLPLVESLKATTDWIGTRDDPERDCGPEATIYFVCDPDDEEEIAAVREAGANVIISKRGHTYAAKANVALDCTDEPWLFICGDDVRFHPGWLDEARKLSDRFDVIGTNDTTGRPKNLEVANGSHADHFFVRRSYVDTYGASLDGPGVVTPECYGHWFVDKEIVELAKARGVFTPCLSSVVEHLHPGYDGRERDEVYVKAMDTADQDRETYRQRRPLIEMARTYRGKR